MKCKLYICGEILFFKIKTYASYGLIDLSKNFILVINVWCYVFKIIKVLEL